MDNSKYKELYESEKLKRIKYQNAHAQIVSDFDSFKEIAEAEKTNAINAATKELNKKVQKANLSNWTNELAKGKRITFADGRNKEELSQLVKETLENKNFDDTGNFIDDKGEKTKIRVLGKDVESVESAYKHLHEKLNFGIPNAVFPEDKPNLKIDNTGSKALKDFFTKSR